MPLHKKTSNSYISFVYYNKFGNPFSYSMPGRAQIVIADDHLCFRDMLSHLIATYGIDVLGTAENGVQLLALLKHCRPDAIILDLEMPELNGSDTLNLLKRDYPSLRTIIVSQFDDSILIKDFLNRGVNAYVPKSRDVATIAKAVFEVVETGSYRENLVSALKIGSIRKNGAFKLDFSRRECEIIHLICKGKQTLEIASYLAIAEKTVEANITEIYRKAKVSTRSEFLIYAIREGLNYLSGS